MTSELQRLVDAVAVELDASTVLEDAEQRMVAMSSQGPLIDDLRRDFPTGLTPADLTFVTLNDTC
jgi:hypothetical protein